MRRDEGMARAHWAAKAASITYALWGVLHVIGGGLLLVASLSGVDAFLAAQTGKTAFSASHAAPPALHILRGVTAYHSFNLVWIGGLVAAIALLLWRKNRPIALWLCLSLVGLTDLGFVLFILKPGIMGISQGWPGLLLFAAALAFSVMGMRKPGMH